MFEWFVLILSIVMIVGVLQLARTFVRSYQEELPLQHSAQPPEPGYRFSADIHPFSADIPAPRIPAPQVPAPSVAAPPVAEPHIPAPHFSAPQIKTSDVQASR